LNDDQRSIDQHNPGKEDWSGEEGQYETCTISNAVQIGPIGKKQSLVKDIVKYQGLVV